MRIGYAKPKIKYIVKKNLPDLRKRDLEPILTPQQVEKLKTAGGVVLALACAVGTLTLAAVAPNAVQLLKYLPGIKYRKKSYKEDEEIVHAVYYLRNRGFIKLKGTGKDFEIKITKKGRKKALKMNIDNLEIPKPEKWDGKWWMTIADVPVTERVHADYLREKLKSLGFYPLQKTVWLYPFDPRDQVEFISTYYEVERFMTILRVDMLDDEDEKELKTFFKKNKIL